MRYNSNSKYTIYAPAHVAINNDQVYTLMEIKNKLCRCQS